MGIVRVVRVGLTGGAPAGAGGGGAVGAGRAVGVVVRGDGGVGWACGRGRDGGRARVWRRGGERGAAGHHRRDHDAGGGDEAGGAPSDDPWRRCRRGPPPARCRVGGSRGRAGRRRPTGWSVARTAMRAARPAGRRAGHGPLIGSGPSAGPARPGNPIPPGSPAALGRDLEADTDDEPGPQQPAHRGDDIPTGVWLARHGQRVGAPGPQHDGDDDQERDERRERGQPTQDLGHIGPAGEHAATGPCAAASLPAAPRRSLAGQATAWQATAWLAIACPAASAGRAEADGAGDLTGAVVAARPGVPVPAVAHASRGPRRPAGASSAGRQLGGIGLAASRGAWRGRRHGPLHAAGRRGRR